MAGDVQLVKNSKNLNAQRVSHLIIGGKHVLKTALYELLSLEDQTPDIIIADEVQLENLAGFGALCVAAERGIIQESELIA